MKFRKLLLVILAVLSFISTIAVKSYRNHKAISFKIDNESQLMGIQSLESQSGVSADKLKPKVNQTQTL